MDFSDNLLIPLIILLVGGSFFGTYKIFRWFFRKLKGLTPQADQAGNFIDGQADKVPDSFDHIIQRLEVDRARYYGKTKGLFKRSFLRTWLVLTTLFITLAVTLSESSEVTAATFIGPVLISAFLSLIGAGIYTLVRKGTNISNFSRQFKRELVTEMVKTVNPALSFDDTGITTEEFDRADLFPDSKNSTSFLSEDKIAGIINGTEVVIAECIKRGRVIRGRTGVELKVKGVSIPVSTDNNFGEGSENVDYFRGLFVQVKLAYGNLATPLKVLPAKMVRKEVETGFSPVGAIQYIKPVLPADRIEVPGARPYEIYCADTEQAGQLVNEKFLKVLDYIYGKYYQKRENADGNVLFKNLFGERNVFMSIRDNMLYLALEWNKDMFEPGTLLKEDLRKSGVVEEAYHDLQFIHQIVQEVSLFNKINV